MWNKHYIRIIIVEFLVVATILVFALLGTKECEHTETFITTIEPTCVQDGREYTICSNCELVLSFEVLPALGHDEVIEINTEPTCTEEGFIKSYCSRCDKVLKEEVIPAKGHSWSDIRCINKATAVRDEVWGSYCVTCGQILFTDTKSRYDVVKEYKAKDPNFYGLLSFSFDDSYVVPLYTSEPKQWQAVVDRWDSALFIPATQRWDADIFADHNYQGFTIITKAYIGSQAYILTEKGLTTITCFDIIRDGYNDGAIRTRDGTLVEELYQNFKYAYTCNADHSTITIVLYR